MEKVKKERNKERKLFFSRLTVIPLHPGRQAGRQAGWLTHQSACVKGWFFSVCMPKSLAEAAVYIYIYIYISCSLATSSFRQHALVVTPASSGKRTDGRERTGELCFTSFGRERERERETAREGERGSLLHIFSFCLASLSSRKGTGIYIYIYMISLTNPLTGFYAL